MSDWSNFAGPIAFRVSSTNDKGARAIDYSNGWVSFAQKAYTQVLNTHNFTFKPQDYNPILVELTDYTLEIYSKYLTF